MFICDGVFTVCVCVHWGLQVGSCLGQYLELLLKAVLSKMQLVQTSTVMQSLLCVFAHLIQHEVRIWARILARILVTGYGGLEM